MNKSTKLGVIALLVVSLVASGAFAFGGFGNEAAREALKDGDYAAWKDAMSAGLTEERFNQMVGRHNQMAENRAEMQQAMEQGYEAWKEAVADSPKGGRLTEVINEENFDTFVKVHEARQNGEIETAKALAEDLGLQKIGKGFGPCAHRFISE